MLDSLRKILSAAGSALAVLAAVATVFGTWLYTRQQRPPVTAPTGALVDGIGDREAIGRVAALPRLGVVLRPGRLALPIENGAELLELFKIADASRLATLRDESPMVRAYTAMHVLLTRPGAAPRLLRPLLADATPLTRGVFDDPETQTTVAEAVVDMACAVAPRAGYDEVRAFIAQARADWRLLRVRGAVERCRL